MGVFAAITSCVGAVVALPPFRAFTYDPSTYELLSYQAGEGDVETDRVAVINVPDMDGVYVEIPGGVVAYPGARVVDNFAKASNDFANTAIWQRLIGGGGSAPIVTLTDEMAPSDELAWRMQAELNGGDTGADYSMVIASPITSAQGRSAVVGMWARSNTGEDQNVYIRTGSVNESALVTSEWKRVTCSRTDSTSGTLYIQFGARGDASDDSLDILFASASCEETTGAPTDIPSEYVPNPSTTGHSTAAFACENGNTVANNIVTEASGPLLDPIPSALVAPEAQNLVLYARDLSQWHNQGSAAVVGAVDIHGGNGAYIQTDPGAVSTWVDTVITGLTGGASVQVKASIAKSGTGIAAIQLTKPTSNVHIDPSTGDWAWESGYQGGFTEATVKSVGNFWELTAQWKPNDVNTTMYLQPARGNVLGGSYDTSVAGSNTFDAVAIYKGITHEAAVNMPPIITDGAASVRDKDEVIIDSANLNATEGSIYFKVTPGQDTTDLLDGFMSLENGFVVIDDGTNATAAVALVDTGIESAVGLVWSAEGMKCCVNGTWSPLVGYDGSLNDGVLDLFRDATASNQMRDLQIWDSVAEQEINRLMPTAEDWGTDFVMVVKTTTPGETFTLPCGDTDTYNANIDWGDGEPDSTITTYDDADLTHTFAEAGNHTIKISGVLPWIYFNNEGDKDKVIGVLNGGSIGSRSCSGMFNGCSNLIALNISEFDTALVTSLAVMFRNCLSLTAIDVSGFDVTLVVSMTYMFRGCSNLIMVDVSGFDFDTALVTNMAVMFRGCLSLTTVDGAVLGNADVISNTTDMFREDIALSQATLDDILAKIYANRSNYTWATPVLDLSPPTAVPSGVYQDATPPTTGEEFRYKLENDPDGEGFNTWSITI